MLIAMRYLLPFVAVLLCSVTLSAQDYSGQEQDSTESIFNEETIQGLALLKTIMNDCPAYELYRTDNMWTFLKLETSTGKIWQVQYAVGDGDAFQVVLKMIFRSLLTEWRLPEGLSCIRLIIFTIFYYSILIQGVSGRRSGRRIRIIEE